MMDNETYVKKLKDFLLDIECLQKLKTSKFNPFDILRVARTEIRHSNVLSWLLNPGENHGFGKAFLEKLNHYIAKNGLVNNDDAFKLLTMNYSDIVVYREWRNIDILIESIEDKYILCIENKIGTRDHDHQLDKYYRVVEDKYRNFTKIYLYLTPEGLAPDEDSHSAWSSIKYEALINIIEGELTKTENSSEAVNFIRSYLEILRRETMEDKDLIKLCHDIYAKHKEALDLIFDNRPDRLQNVADFFLAWCKKKDKEGLLILDEEKCSKSYLRFRTASMDNFILPSENVSGWNTKNHYYYEICSNCDKNDDIKFSIQLSFNSANLEPSNLAQLEKIIKVFHPNKPLKTTWQWKTVFKSKTKTIKSDEILPESVDEENNIYTNLDKMFDEILKKEKEVLAIE